jgi:hypothetical protein
MRRKGPHGTEGGERGAGWRLRLLIPLLGLSCAHLPPSPAAPGKEREVSLRELLPAEAGGRALLDSATAYDEKTIFRYMDGAAEVYLSFDFRSLLVARYPGPDGDTLTVELYDMGSSTEAFGIFSRNRSGEDRGIGQGSEYRSGYLLFWKDRVLGTVWTSVETERSREGVLDLGRAIAKRIPKEGPLPDILGLLPTANRDPRSVRYFHKHTDLNEHYFLSDDNILGLGTDTEAALASYAFPPAEPLLLVVRYPDEARAASAEARLRETFLLGAGPSGVARLEDGSCAGAGRTGRRLLLVLDAPDTETAERFLADARALTQGDDR